MSFVAACVGLGKLQALERFLVVRCLEQMFACLCSAYVAVH